MKLHIKLFSTDLPYKEADIVIASILPVQFKFSSSVHQQAECTQRILDTAEQQVLGNTHTFFIFKFAPVFTILKLLDINSIFETASMEIEHQETHGSCSLFHINGSFIYWNALPCETMEVHTSSMGKTISHQYKQNFPFFLGFLNTTQINLYKLSKSGLHSSLETNQIRRSKKKLRQFTYPSIYRHCKYKDKKKVRQCHRDQITEEKEIQQFSEGKEQKD